MTNLGETVEAPRKIHPVVKINYIPRTVAAAFFVLIVWSILGKALLTWQYFWLIPLGIIWPHITYFFSIKSENGKRQELINMHLDAFLVALVAAVAPNFYLFSATIILLSANGLFIGAVPLLLSTMAVYFLTIGFFYLAAPFSLIEIKLLPKILISSLMLIQFSTFAIVSYSLVRKLVALNKRVEQLSIVDPLTKCFNRLYLDRNLAAEIHRCKRLKYPVTAIFADLDHFKNINDQYGHQAGDDILKQFVKVTQESIRENVDWIARFGGEEFVIVLPNTSAENGAIVAERVRNKLYQFPFEFAGDKLKVSCSFGVVSIDMNTGDVPVETFIASADSGMYQAKAKGRNRVEVVEFVTSELS